MKKIIVLLVLVLSCGMLFGQKYTKKKDYSDGLAAVFFQDRWGFVDKNDKLVINYAFEDVKPFSNGVAQVKYQGKWIYIDKKGKVTSAPQIAQNNISSSSSSSSNSSNRSMPKAYLKDPSSSNNNNSSSSSNKSNSSSSYNSSSSSSNNSSKSSSSSSNYQTSSNSSGNSSSSRQNEKVRIYGKVTCNGVPVSNATVNYTPFYQGTDGRNTTVKTDANGNYTLYVPRTEVSPSDGYLVWCESDYGSENKYFENKSNYKKGDQHYDIALVNKNNYTSSSYSSNSSSKNSSSNSSSYKNDQDYPDEDMIEKDGFHWIRIRKINAELSKQRGYPVYYCGAKSINGEVLIPPGKYDYFFYVCGKNSYYEGIPPYFYVRNEVSGDTYRGAVTIDGRVIVEPKYGYLDYDVDSDVFVFQASREYDTDGKLKPYYSIGVSLTKEGEPYMSNNGIVSYSKYYSAPKTSNSYNNSYSSSSSTPTAPILNADNLSKGVIAVAAGAAIIAGIADLFKGSSSSSSSSNNKNASVDNTIRVNSKVKCYVWEPNKRSGWHGRVTEIDGDKCSVRIDKIVVKGLTQCVLNACEASGWVNLSSSVTYSGNERCYGAGTIITVPKHYLEIDN